MPWKYCCRGMEGAGHEVFLVPWDVQIIFGDLKNENVLDSIRKESENLQPPAVVRF